MKRISFCIPQYVYEKIDKQAKEHQISFSEVLRMVIFSGMASNYMFHITEGIKNVTELEKQ